MTCGENILLEIRGGSHFALKIGHCILIHPQLLIKVTSKTSAQHSMISPETTIQPQIVDEVLW